jgi:formylglycine-generating enzyme required for sulfatase activity
MSGFWRRVAMVGPGVLMVAAALIDQRASSDDCVYGHACAEDKKDGRGCCSPPSAEKSETAKNAAKVKEGAEANHVTATAPQGPSCPKDMVPVPAGTFMMGSPAGGGKDEHQHRVTLPGYCIDRTEVTAGAYARCVTRGKCTAAREPAKDDFFDSLCNGTRVDRQDHPVNCVDWDQAVAYCRSVAKRLPSEEEWEYAARGSDGRKYPWGNEPPSAKRLNACGSECRALGKRLGVEWQVMYADTDGFEATAPVGSFPLGASPFGALDMAGNVLEWTADRYGPYSAGTSTNPHSAEKMPARVARGGGWYTSDAGGVRAARRDGDGPTGRFSTLGFRCVHRD